MFLPTPHWRSRCSTEGATYLPVSAASGQYRSGRASLASGGALTHLYTDTPTLDDNFRTDGTFRGHSFVPLIAHQMRLRYTIPISARRRPVGFRREAGGVAETDGMRTTDGALPLIARVTISQTARPIVVTREDMRLRAAGRRWPPLAIKRAVINLQHKKELPAT
jgi:hypothetical protein